MRNQRTVSNAFKVLAVGVPGNDGITLTPAVARSMPPEMIQAQVRERAIPRDEKGEDLVGTVFFLALPDADFMSEQTLNVDGGKQML
jgi:NAD(P)-dependent dehydrogenase (short-subunit alcohol dehydrogenase family)